MDPQSIVGGEKAYPLNSKRLKLKHIQQLALTLDLPATATRDDLEVMISGKLAEMGHDATNVQVVITQSEEGEQLSLRDMGGTFWVTPPLASKSPTPTPSQEEAGSFTTEMTQLRNVLQMLEEGTVVLQAELQATREEVKSLEAELDKANERLVELWQENCQQLLDHDITMVEKEQEVQQLREQLQAREMEIVRLKLTGLKGAAMPSGTSATTAASTSLGISGDVMPTDSVQKGSSARIGTNLSTAKVTTWQQSPKQGGHVSTCTTTTVTTVTNLLPSGHVFASTTANLSQGGSNGIEPTHSLLGRVPVTRPLVTTSIPNTCQAQLSKLEWPQPLGETKLQSLTSQPQSNQQVTNLNTSLSDTLYVSRPVSSIGTVNHGKFIAEGHACAPRRGKAPPIDPFTAEDVGITFDDWLPILERAAIWNEWTPEESLMQLAGHLRGRALQEWKLLLPDDRKAYQAAVKALKERLDPGNQTLAALDFRHTSQKVNESVADFIGRLEQVFQTGFG